MSYRIVVVDDDLLSLKSAKALLDDQDMLVSCLRSGKDLLKYLEKNTPDIILLDILMPDMDGFETYRAVRNLEEKEKKPQTPIIFLTGENNSEVERRGLKEGASDFIRKPLDKDILVKRIANTVDSNRKIESLTEEATLDKLTGFLNKASGTDKISDMCEIQEGALMLLDLDNFKLVNDLFGHDMGDRVLVAFSNVVRHYVRSDDVVCRIGGDEFMAFLPKLLVENAVASLTERLNLRLAREADNLMGENHGIPLGISIGVAFAPFHAKEYNALFHYADTALYRAKQNGKHSYAIYETQDFTASDEGNLEHELERVSQILGERGDRKGTMILGKEAFSWNYRFIIRFIERYNAVATKMLLSLSFGAGSVPAHECIEEFSKVLQKNLRSSDIIFQNRPNQFFIVLPLLSREDAPSVVDRVLTAWADTPYADLLRINSAMSLIQADQH